MRRSRIGQGEMLHGSRRFWVGGFAAGMAACIALSLTVLPARSETLEAALVQAYQNNPSLNSQRAATRAIDEGVPQALAGYRPKVDSDRHRRRADLVDDVKDGAGRGGDLAAHSPATMGRLRSALQPPRRCTTAIRPPTRHAPPRARFAGAREGLRVLEQTVLLGRNNLHGLSARRGDRRGSAQQRPRPRPNSQADP